MPVTYVGPLCARRGCRRPDWREGLCHACWRLAHMFGKDPRMFAFQPLDGYAAENDAVALPWDRLEGEAQSRGVGLADLFGEDPSTTS